jgi:putative transposase
MIGGEQSIRRSRTMRGHHPPHIYLDRTWYLLTAGTVDRAPLLASDAAKTIVRDALKTYIQRFQINLRAWVILDDHYHILIHLPQGEDLPRFIARFHGGSSRQLNLLDGTKGRSVWHNYWDSGIRTEADLWTRFNYVHHNPVKHGYVQQAADWPFSSYRYFLRTRGAAWLADCLSRYPVLER